MPAITLPDGSIRRYDHPVSPRDIAASIGPGLAKAALAAKVDGKLVDTSEDHRPRCLGGDRHRQGPRRPRRHPPFDGASARLCGEGAISRRAGDDRPGDRGRLLLRFLVQAPVHARRPRRDRSEDGRAREKGRAGHAQADAARRRGRVFQVARRALQSRDHRVDSVERADLALHRGEVHRPLPRPARALDRQAQGVQADEARGRVLARRLEERDAAADLRHRVGEKGRPGRVPVPPRGSGEARPSQSSAGSSISSTCRTKRPGWCSGTRRAGRSGSRSSSTCAASTRTTAIRKCAAR